jgi:hypothetical protein
VTRTESPPQVWVDANVVLRLLTGQPEAQARAAAALMARADAGELRLHLCPLTISAGLIEAGTPGCYNPGEGALRALMPETPL